MSDPRRTLNEWFDLITECRQSGLFAIEKKQSVALVGGSGGGKTTVADIVLGRLQPESGTVSADGTSIFEKLKEWHAMLAYIPQSIYLTDDTVRANVAFGIHKEEIEDERVWEALEEAQLAEFFRKQPDGIYSTVAYTRSYEELKK